MAYSTSNPPRSVVESFGTAEGNIYVYKDGDSVSTVTGINYIQNATELGMKAGDKVVHMDETLGTTTDLTVVAGATPGTAVGALCSAIEPVAETSIALDSAGTGTILVNDIIWFDNDPDRTEYRVTTGDTDVSDGGTIVITPGLAVATAVGTKIVVKSDVLNLSAGFQGSSVISGAGATRDITAAESGSTFLFDRAAGISYTLPVGTVGLKYRFVTTVDLTSNAYAVLCNTDTAGDFLVGAVQGAIEGAATDETHMANGTTHLGISSNATTTGGLIGGWYDVECVADNLWFINGVVSCTATPATPFTT